MKINGIDVVQYELSYDAIIKHDLARSDEVTVRSINGMFGDSHPLDSKVEWLEKESVDDEYRVKNADKYLRINGVLYAIEFESGDYGDMATRIYRYSSEAAKMHSTTSVFGTMKTAFPKSMVIYLDGRRAPEKLTWEITMPDDQLVVVDIPVIRLANLSVSEISERNLFPVGQFYLRKFAPLTEAKITDFERAGRELLEAMNEAVNDGRLPYHLAAEMSDNVRKTANNVMSNSKLQEVELEMVNNIVETLPWIDYKDLFEKIEARGKAEGKAEGVEFTKLETAQRMLADNLPLEQIAKFTLLPFDMIRKLRDNEEQ